MLLAVGNLQAKVSEGRERDVGLTNYRSDLQLQTKRSSFGRVCHSCRGTLGSKEINTFDLNCI